ncbi:hypothetical protein CJ030_MR2G013647 [Morella rubra]|uniref:Profilin n=1 Tax=Morella rubra TaxID=262757 RepID=A0A6A1WHF4_9ROSI|nr:hypothetical protein CJ030_MR2G013647 [Morella rubra]
MKITKDPSKIVSLKPKLVLPALKRQADFCMQEISVVDAVIVEEGLVESGSKNDFKDYIINVASTFLAFISVTIGGWLPLFQKILKENAEQEGIKANPMELNQFMDFIRCNKLRTESFILGANQYLVTSIHENWFCARCINTSKPAGEGAIIIQTTAYFLVALYDGSIGSASRAMVAVDQFAWQLGRRNL